MKPTVPEVLPLAVRIYNLPRGGVGCCLHIVLDDNNVDDGSVRFCINQAKERGHADCLELGEKLLLMSKTQRLKLGSFRLGYCDEQGKPLKAVLGLPT